VKLVQIRYLIQAPTLADDPFWNTALRDVERAIQRVVWPKGNPSKKFIIHPQSGKKRGKGNGVVPIKEAFLVSLADDGWSTDDRQNPGRFDAVKRRKDGRYFGMEWETGNISSSHRALNRFLLQHIRGDCLGGVLVLPTRKLYAYLTDRVGNFEELATYFPVWEQISWDHGGLAVIAVEHDGEDLKVPRIEKGTDGRALL